MTAPASKSSNDPVAEAYFLAAAKRLGLLGAGLTDIQCLFLASMYQKCALRPLEAWFHVHQAATRLQARHLGRIAGLQRGASGNEKWLSHLEQRLLWSCFKAERSGTPSSHSALSCRLTFVCNYQRTRSRAGASAQRD